MKRWISICFILGLLGAGAWAAKKSTPKQEWTFYEDSVLSATNAQQVLPETIPELTIPPETVPPATVPTEAPAETTMPEVLTFTEEEEELLLKLGMSERGSTGCTTCMALVMRTALNRVESPKFSSTIKGVIYATEQFTPVMDGSFETAQPDWLCEEALKMVKQGWDESQGALYYEWCEGESWHSQNLNLLLQHCDTRFYN